MTDLYSPKNEVELALIRSLLDAEGMPYHVRNDRFGSLEVGPQIESFNVRTIMVPEEYRERAAGLVADFLQSTRDADTAPASQRSLLDKIRVVLEAALFGWFVPGRKWRDK